MSVYGINGNVLNAAYSVSGSQLSNVYDKSGNIIDVGAVREWLDTAVISALPNISVGGVKQGGCTDGTYIYQCSGDSTNYTYMNVIKYKISDGTYTTVRFDGIPNFGHANDMTYDPNTGYLYVATMLSDGSIIVLDADDLSYVDTVYAVNESGDPYYVWQICYDRLSNKFYSSLTDNSIGEYDSEWNFIKAISIPNKPNATAQGCETDGTYFYRVWYNPNMIGVCSLTGEFVKNITNPVSGELESLMYDWNGNYYFSGYNTPSLFYGIQLYTES